MQPFLFTAVCGAFFLIASHHEAQVRGLGFVPVLAGRSISREANIMQAAVCLLFCRLAVGAFGRGDGRPDGAARNHCRIIKTDRTANYRPG